MPAVPPAEPGESVPTFSRDEGVTCTWYVPAATPVKLYEPSVPVVAMPPGDTNVVLPELPTLCNSTVMPAKPASPEVIVPALVGSR